MTHLPWHHSSKAELPMVMGRGMEADDDSNLTGPWAPEWVAWHLVPPVVHFREPRGSTNSCGAP